MRISSERLAAEADATGFAPEILEKVLHLIQLLGEMTRYTFLAQRLVLKGGTALNLFVLDLPRLSVDIDLNYIGSGELAGMQRDRPGVETALRGIFSRSGYEVRRAPNEHAGGKWQLRYPSAQGDGGNIEVDLNYMYRVPLWPPAKLDSRDVGSYRVDGVPVLDVHELAAGKLAALFARTSPRDFFDTHQVLTRIPLERDRLRLAFVVYGAMNRVDWRTVSLSRIGSGHEGLLDQLRPMLRRHARPPDALGSQWAARIAEETIKALETVLPFTPNELDFLDRLLDEGEIAAELLTADEELADRIRKQPGLQWKASNVRKHRLE